MSEFPYKTKVKYKYLASILIPTRKRIGALVDCLTSIKNKTHNLDRIEVVIRADKDDYETLENMHRVHNFDTDFDIKIIVDDRWGGYADLHLIQNQMYLESTGEFLIGMNDDAVFHSDGWDVELEKHSGKVGLIEGGVKEFVGGDRNTNVHNPREHKEIDGRLMWRGGNATTHTFIILHREVPMLLGYYCMDPSADRQWDIFIRKQPTLKIVEYGIEIHHHILPAEHVKDGIITDPDNVYRHREELESDSEILIEKMKKNYC